MENSRYIVDGSKPSTIEAQLETSQQSNTPRAVSDLKRYYSERKLRLHRFAAQKKISSAVADFIDANDGREEWISVFGMLLRDISFREDQCVHCVDCRRSCWQRNVILCGHCYHAFLLNGFAVVTSRLAEGDLVQCTRAMHPRQTIGRKACNLGTSSALNGLLEYDTAWSLRKILGEMNAPSKGATASEIWLSQFTESGLNKLIRAYRFLIEIKAVTTFEDNRLEVAERIRCGICHVPIDESTCGRLLPSICIDCDNRLSTGN